MAYSTIPKGSLYMNTKLYTGTGSSNSVTGVGFQPDMTWFKHRNGTSEHNIYDAVRGATKRIIPNDATAEGTQSNGLSAFGSDGFTVVDSNATNLNNGTYASWNWKANGQGSSNTDGSINTTYTSVNTTSGFSISQYTGNGSASTIGHGLGVIPKMIIVKALSTTGQWAVQHTILGAGRWIELDSNAASDTSTPIWNNTEPTSSVFTVGTNARTNTNGTTYVAYCFANVQGYSKMGAYMGNGSTGGSSGIGTSFVHCGFSPAFVLIKNGQQVNDWLMFDNKRQGFNVDNEALDANLTSAERTTNYLNFFSNGFGLSSTSGEVNSAGVAYIFQAFAENPFVATSGTTAVPATAR